MQSLTSSSHASTSSQPIPSYILRSHTSQISILTFSHCGRSLYSGDVDGWVGVWDLRTYRPRLFWQAHTAGVLSLEEWDNGLITHGRDNKIYHHVLPTTHESINKSGAVVPSPKDPTNLSPEWEMDVNAMAYCRLSLLRTGKEGGREQGLIAVPSLTKDEQVDIFHLPSLSRVHRSVGANAFPINDKTGTVMAVSLFYSPALSLLVGFEDGRVAYFHFEGTMAEAVDPPTGRREEGRGWSLVWEEKGHREALMDIALSPDKKTAWSVAADHYLCRYSLDAALDPDLPRMDKFETTSPGRSSISIRADGRLVAVAGWDGKARLYSTKTGAPLAVLSYHRTSLHALAFGPLPSSAPDEDDSYSDDDEGSKTAWLAVGGKDGRVSLWSVYPVDTVARVGA